jgi:hypothetical protein
LLGSNGYDLPADAIVDLQVLYDGVPQTFRIVSIDPVTGQLAGWSPTWTTDSGDTGGRMPRFFFCGL